MKLFRQLLQVFLLAAASLILAAGVTAALLAVLVVIDPDEIPPLAAASGGFLGTLAFGALPAFVIGVPAYVSFWRKGQDSWRNVLALGGVAGCTVGIIQAALLPYGLACGIVVAGLTHAGKLRWVGPNNSFKPNPLRGSA